MLIKNQSVLWVFPSAKHIGSGSVPGILIKCMFSFPLLIKVWMKHEENDTQISVACEGFEMLSQHFFFFFSPLRQTDYLLHLGFRRNRKLMSQMTIQIAFMDVSKMLARMQQITPDLRSWGFGEECVTEKTSENFEERPWQRDGDCHNCVIYSHSCLKSILQQLPNNLTKPPLQ